MKLQGKLGRDGLTYPGHIQIGHLAQPVCLPSGVYILVVMDRWE